MFKILPIKGTISDIDGFYCDGINTGLKTSLANEKQNKADPDVGFIYSDVICNVAEIFTQNKFKAAPLVHYLNNKDKCQNDFETNFILINSKNANAMTGQSGIDDIDYIFDNLKLVHKNIKNPIMSSTGVIGVALPKNKILEGAKSFDLTKKDGVNLSKAIMTTDKYPKTSLYEVKLENNKSFKIGAVAKGAGMINPSLATMLCFICTDANISTNEMKELLLQHNKTTFDAISVDGDTSTNDTVMLLSNKKSNCYDKDAFSEALAMVMKDISMLIVSDGEGATKHVAFEIIGAKDENDARRSAKKLSNSLLMKTALFGEDPNWGRIASTIGSSGVKCHENSLKISFIGQIGTKITEILVYDKGEVYFDEENELLSTKILKNSTFTIKCDLGMGDASYTAYGCDLGYEYVKINGDYRT